MHSLYSTCEWLLLCFFREIPVKLFLKILSSGEYKKCWFLETRGFRVSKLNSFHSEYSSGFVLSRNSLFTTDPLFSLQSPSSIHEGRGGRKKRMKMSVYRLLTQCSLALCGRLKFREAWIKFQGSGHNCQLKIQSLLIVSFLWTN